MVAHAGEGAVRIVARSAEGGCVVVHQDGAASGPAGEIVQDLPDGGCVQLIVSGGGIGTGGLDHGEAAAAAQGYGLADVGQKIRAEGVQAVCTGGVVLRTHQVDGGSGIQGGDPVIEARQGIGQALPGPAHDDGVALAAAPAVGEGVHLDAPDIFLKLVRIASDAADLGDGAGGDAAAVEHPGVAAVILALGLKHLADAAAQGKGGILVVVEIQSRQGPQLRVRQDLGQDQDVVDGAAEAVGAAAACVVGVGIDGGQHTESGFIQIHGGGPGAVGGQAPVAVGIVVDEAGGVVCSGGHICIRGIAHEAAAQLVAELGAVGAHIAAAVRAENSLDAGDVAEICLVEDGAAVHGVQRGGSLALGDGDLAGAVEGDGVVALVEQRGHGLQGLHAGGFAPDGGGLDALCGDAVVIPGPQTCVLIQIRAGIGGADGSPEQRVIGPLHLIGDAAFRVPGQAVGHVPGRDGQARIGSLLCLGADGHQADDQDQRQQKTQKTLVIFLHFFASFPVFSRASHMLPPGSGQTGRSQRGRCFPF